MRPRKLRVDNARDFHVPVQFGAWGWGPVRGACDRWQPGQGCLGHDRPVANRRPA